MMFFNKKIIFIILGVVWSLNIRAQVTIEECLAKAEANYPVISKYRLLEATRDIDLAEINNSWLPRIGAYGQATGQNVVPTFPKSLAGVLDQMGQTVEGLGKIQYKIGVDVSQNIWDGGVSSARRELARAQEEVSRSALDVEMYAVRQRVESVFFALLLTEEQIEQSEITRRLLQKNLEQLRSKVRNGVAMQSDADMVEAQVLTVSQGISQAKSAADGYRKALEIFTGESLQGKTLSRPSAEVPLDDESRRPELKLFENKLNANAVSNRLSDTSLMPKVGMFAQAYYGYPGFDYFKSMMNRNLSFNILAGVKVSWNIDSFYSRKNNSRRTSVNALDINADKDLFLFNTSIQSASQREAISGLREVMKDDARIIELRGKVRQAAESQLANGVIDATALLTKISDENMAQLNGRLHEIQFIKEIYNLKYTLNQ
ncbi:MAG: TolC family protein [Muribaculaceae bacterium]|nr:TolC family protein [Muribaculaceae bacterium]